jgi:hypothetical protein
VDRTADIAAEEAVAVHTAVVEEAVTSINTNNEDSSFIPQGPADSRPRGPGFFMSNCRILESENRASGPPVPTIRRKRARYGVTETKSASLAAFPSVYMNNSPVCDGEFPL